MLLLVILYLIGAILTTGVALGIGMQCDDFPPFWIGLFLTWPICLMVLLVKLVEFITRKLISIDW